MRRTVVTLGGLLFVVVLGTATIWLFYAIEDARGAAAWELAQKKIQDAGESVDYRDLIPPEIPDEQNLAAIPLFLTKPNSDNQNDMEAAALKTAFTHFDATDNPAPIPKVWMRGEDADFGAIDKFFSEHYKKVFGDAPVPPTTLEKIDALCPALSKLREASVTRPLCRFPRDYISTPPYLRELGSTTSLIKLAKVLNMHALVALHENRPDVALEDIDIVLKIAAAVSREPVLISGLVSIGIVAIQFDSLWEGLNDHKWTDPQLADLQQHLHAIDFLASGQLCLRGEATGFFAPTMDYIQRHRAEGALLTTMSNVDPTDGINVNQSIQQFLGRLICWLTPQGWFDQAKARGVTTYFAMAREPIDLITRRVDPVKAKKFDQPQESLSFGDLPGLYLAVAIGPMAHSVSKFAEGQFRVDAAYLACALERYRLAHGTYPETLEALKPYAPNGLPHDMITGRPYRYKLNPEGTYLLYSVGWNQVDDGGKVAYKPSDSKALDWEQGDWVWPAPKH